MESAVIYAITRLNLFSLILGLFITPTAIAKADTNQPIEEIIVTGSYIKQTPGDATLPVDVMNSQDIFNQGSPSMVELIRNMNASAGSDGETNQFQSNGLAGTSNINLRGLGAGRNLVLLNGRRNVFHPFAISEQAQLFVNTNNIPAIAIQRVETLKDGAAATYGSDAISGVINFITRSNFDGLEVNLSHKDIADSQGTQDIGLIWGTRVGTDATRFVASLSASFRNELKVKDRDWAIKERAENGNFTSYSSSPHPGAYTGIDANGNPLSANLLTDPDCANVVGYFPRSNFSNIDVPSFRAYEGLGALVNPTATGSGDPASPDGASASLNSGKCTYNYSWFDNLMEKEEHFSAFLEFEHDFGDHLFKAEALFSDTNVPNWNSSPSYPPQNDFDTNRAIARIVNSDHPGLIDMVSSFPTSALATYVNANCSLGTANEECLYYRGRPFGAGGPGEKRGSRHSETLRFVGSFEGALTDEIDYLASLTFSTSEAGKNEYDTVVEKWSAALEGYGGPDCIRGNGAPGAGNCMYYNPFSNAIQYGEQKFTSYTNANPNPNYRATVANDKETLIPWMTELVATTISSELTVFDTVFTGVFNDQVSWALGQQYRSEAYDVTPKASNNLNINPCQTVAENTEFQNSGRIYSNADGANNCSGSDGVFGTSDDYQGSGKYIFLAGGTPSSDTQSIFALFGEIAYNPLPDLDIQLSARFEDYGGSVGETFDPKLAIRYRASDTITLRASASTTFRGPTLNQLSGRDTSLEYVNAVGTFKAVDTDGNDKLSAETANTLNLGIIFQEDSRLLDGDSIFASLDYWHFDFTDPIIKENFNAIVNNVFTNSAASADVNSAYFNRISCGISNCTGKTLSDISRVNVKLINGPDIETDGFDFNIRYGLDILLGRAEFSLQGTKIETYNVAETALQSPLASQDGNALGRLNDDISFLRPLIDLKYRVGAKYERDYHTVNLMMNYTNGYQDSSSIGGTPLVPREVAAHITYDLHYNIDLGDIAGGENTDLWVSVYNISDRNPPSVRRDLNYDPYTHNPFGRMIKIGIRHRF